MAELLDHAGQPDSVIAAGLLHDTLEKTATTPMSSSSASEQPSHRLVESVTDDATIDDYATRKRDLRERVRHAGADTWALFAADKITNQWGSWRNYRHGD